MFFCVVTLFGLWKKKWGKIAPGQNSKESQGAVPTWTPGRAGLGWRGPQARSSPGALLGQDIEVSKAKAVGADCLMTWVRAAEGGAAVLVF